MHPVLYTIELEGNEDIIFRSSRSGLIWRLQFRL